MAAAAPHRVEVQCCALLSVTATGPEGTAWSCVGGGAGWGLGKGSSPEIGQEQE